LEREGLTPPSRNVGATDWSPLRAPYLWGPHLERRQAGAYIYYHAVGAGLPALNLASHGHGSIPLVLAHTRLVERDWERVTGRPPLFAPCWWRY